VFTNAANVIDQLYRAQWGRIVATLIGLLGDFDLAEDAAQEAFAAAAASWQTSGIPDNPRAWIIQAARNKAIDRLRRRTNFDAKMEMYVASGFLRTTVEPAYDDAEIPDDRLRLIFTCCHPALAPDAQIALTLRVLCGLETDEIARAFLVPPATMAQRLVRAKRKIREARIPYAVPDVNDMPQRLEPVLTVVYLVFNEGYAATRGKTLVRADLCGEAIRLARLLRMLIKPQPPPEVTGLLALMLLHDARRDARTDREGNIILLEEQDRSQWNHGQILEALPLATEAMQGGAGPYALQAAIAAAHCRAERATDTDWPQIVRLYDALERLQSSPIVSLNRAVAVAMADGPEQGLRLVDRLVEQGKLDAYHLLHATRADFLRRLGAKAQAIESYRRAISLATNTNEIRFLQERLSAVEGAPDPTEGERGLQ
jgi:RNA polymerase sigma-70 factor (ECF subfamily)